MTKTAIKGKLNNQPIEVRLKRWRWLDFGPFAVDVHASPGERILDIHR